MAWVTPIFDRVLSDVTTPTSKGYFNVADWVRIDGNTTEVRSVLTTAGYLGAALADLTEPGITNFPSAALINALILNIERVREAACLPAALANLHILPHAWGDGANAAAPDYEDVNDWEETLSVIYTAVPKAVDYFIPCGVAACGQARLWQNRFR